MRQDKEFLFIGDYCPPALVGEFIGAGSIPDFAGFNLQDSLIKGFDQNGVNLRVISEPYVSAYPKYKRAIIRDKSFNHHTKEIGRGNDILLGFLNIPIFKMFSKMLRLRKYLRKILKGDKKNVVLYSLHSPHILAVILNRKYINSISVIVTDLPQYMSGNKNLLYALAKSIDRVLINFALKKVDSFVLLSEQMKDYLPIGENPYIVIEGVYNEENSTENSLQKPDSINDKKIILMYSGGINRRYGVYNLVEAFKGIVKLDLELWLCGPVDNSQDFNKVIESDPRIKYFGLLPNNKVREMQISASLLINPRLGSSKFTRFSFPSKTLEYMASGTPTLMAKLPSLPPDYLPHVLIFEEETVEGLRNSIIDFLNIPLAQRKEFGIKAKEFILKNKNPKTQIQKILTLFN